jgi:hypothetical protein
MAGLMSAVISMMRWEVNSFPLPVWRITGYPTRPKYLFNSNATYIGFFLGNKKGVVHA